jgi:nucleotide-binding universal stress UspA family protein
VKRILVGLDGSPRAPAVLDTAIAIARAQNARLVLLRAVGLPPDIPQDFWKTTDQPLAEVMKTRAESYLTEQAAKVPPELLEAVETHVGAPWETVCEVARARAADLVVIGSHGYGGVDRLIGTTAAKIVNHAPCSVLVVRETK